MLRRFRALLIACALILIIGSLSLWQRGHLLSGQVSPSLLSSPSSSSESSHSAVTSSSSISSLGSWLSCPPAYKCTREDDNGSCAVTSIDCPSGFVSCDIFSCGRDGCGGQCCQCKSALSSIPTTRSSPLSASSRSSSSSRQSNVSSRSSAASSFSSGSQIPDVLATFEGGACAPFCTREAAGKRTCKIICGNFPSSPTPEAFLCQEGEQLKSFSCTFQGDPVCTYACTENNE